MDSSTALRLAQAIADQYIAQIRQQHAQQQQRAMAQYEASMAAIRARANVEEEGLVEVVEDATPVCGRSLKRATTAPKTILSFFSAAPAAKVSSGNASSDGGVSRAATSALSTPASLKMSHGSGLGGRKRDVKRRATQSSGSMAGFLTKEAAVVIPVAVRSANNTRTKDVGVFTRMDMGKRAADEDQFAAGKKPRVEVVTCPICSRDFPSDLINGHLDVCLATA